ncbi:MAG: hypothetical protein CSA04_04530, partial [Bacteroidetes bacterium]
AIKTGCNVYLGLTQKDITKKNFKSALSNAQSVLKYDEKNGNAYYLMAVANNNLNNTDAAIEAGTKSLEYSDNSQETQAGIHLELGKAYEAAGNSAQACKEYKLAAFGKFKAEAEYKTKEVLKCQ